MEDGKLQRIADVSSDLGHSLVRVSNIFMAAAAVPLLVAVICYGICDHRARIEQEDYAD